MFLQKQITGIKEPPYKFSFIMEDLVIGQEAAIALTANSKLYKLDKQDTNEGGSQILLIQGMRVLQNACFTEISVRYSKPVG